MNLFFAAVIHDGVCMLSGHSYSAESIVVKAVELV